MTPQTSILEFYRLTLAKLRERAGLTQRELGIVLDKGTTPEGAQVWVSRRELGKTRITANDAATWAEACGYRHLVTFVPDDFAGDDLLAALAQLEPDELVAFATLARRLPTTENGLRSVLVRQLDALSQG